MTLLKPNAPIPKPIDPIKVQITNEGYKGVTVDSAVTPLANLIQYTEGSPWEVEYFSQVLDGDSEPQPHQIGRSAPYQQYVLIKGLEIRVTQALAPSQDPESKSMIIEGSAIVPLGVIPNKGDVFFADIGQGREAELVVTASERKTQFKQSVYAITYEVTNYSDHDVSRTRTDLDSKIVKVAHYVKDHNFLGVNPLMLSEDFNYRIDFQKQYRDLSHYYFADFYSYEFATLLIPDQTLSAYDPFLVSELLNWVDVEDNAILAKITRPRVTMQWGREPDTVWSAISKRDYSLVRNSVQKMGLMHRSFFRGQPDLGGFYYLGVDNCVFPKEARTDSDGHYAAGCGTPPNDVLKAGKGRYNDLTRLTPVGDLPGLYYQSQVSGASGIESLPMIAPVNTSGYYVFSEAFYTGNATLASDLERLLVRYLKEDTLDKPLLKAIASSAMQWDNLERFYYIPVLLALLRVAIRDN